MTRTVWAVSSGEYSDYHPLFLCASQEVAEQAATNLRGDDDGYDRDAFVESFELFDAPPKRVRVYTMQACIDGDRVSGAWRRRAVPEMSERNAWEYDNDATRRPHVRVWRAPMTGEGVNLCVKGTSRSAVLKAYSDRLAKLLATPEEARV